MNFYQKRSRSTNVPILPLIDILAILLIFFIATMTFKPDEAEKVLLEIIVPRSAELPGVESPNPSKTATISVNSEGAIFIDLEKVELEDLSDRIKKLKEERTGLKLELNADEGVKFGELVTIWDALAKAGFPMKNFATRLERPKDDAGVE